MNKKMRTSVCTIALLLLIVLPLGCTGAQSAGEGALACTGSCSVVEEGADSAPVVNIDKLEVYHFHGTNQCDSCKTVGAYAEETVNTYFPDGVASGKIVFGHINGDLPENRELIMKYGVTSASLWLGVYDENGFHPEHNTNVWYRINDKQEYMDYLKGVIEKRLAGDFS